LVYFLSLQFVAAVGAGKNVRSSFSQRTLIMGYNSGQIALTIELSLHVNFVVSSPRFQRAAFTTVHKSGKQKAYHWFALGNIS